MNPVLDLRMHAGLTQFELADRAGTSQPTIAAYESGAKSPTLRTLRRLAASAGFEFHAAFVPPMTREDRRSLALHSAISAKLLADPAGVQRTARRNLARLADQHPAGGALWSEWRRWLSRPVDELASLLVDPRPRARELRHATPFAGVLRAAERADVYRRFRATEHAGEP